MDDETYAAYTRLREQLPVDELRLDVELVRLPNLQMDTMEFTAAAKARLDTAKHDADVVFSDVCASIRQTTLDATGKMPTAEFMKTEPELYDEVREARKAIIDAEWDHSLWRGLHDAVRTKSSSIRAIADLYQANYVTPDSLHTKRIAVMGEQRQTGVTK